MVTLKCWSGWDSSRWSISTCAWEREPAPLWASRLRRQPAKSWQRWRPSPKRAFRIKNRESTSPDIESTEPMIPLLTAFQFLTIFPAVIRRSFTAGELGRAVGYFPIVGLVLGGIFYGMDTGLRLLFAAPLIAVMI